MRHFRITSILTLTKTLFRCSLLIITHIINSAQLMANSLAWGMALAVFSQCSSYAAALPLLLLIGLLSAVFMSLNMTLMQIYSSLEMRGRIVSMAMMTFGLMPLSAVPFGALAERIGTPDSLALSGIILTLASVGFFFAFPKFRRVE